MDVVQQFVSVLFGDIYEIWRALEWWWSLGVRQFDLRGNVPLDGRYQQIFRNYGFGSLGLFIPLIHSRKGISLGVLGTRPVCDSEV